MAWGLTSRLRLPCAANKSGSEAIHRTGLHGVLTLVSGRRATKIVPLPSAGALHAGPEVFHGVRHPALVFSSYWNAVCSLPSLVYYSVFALLLSRWLSRRSCDCTVLPFLPGFRWASETSTVSGSCCGLWYARELEWIARCTFVITFIAILEYVVELRWRSVLLVRFALGLVGVSPSVFVVLRRILVVLFSRFLSESDLLYVVPGAVFFVYLLVTSSAFGPSSWAGVEKKFFMIELECSFSCSFLYSFPSESSTCAVHARSSAFPALITHLDSRGVFLLSGELGIGLP